MSPRSCGTAVEDACLGNILFLFKVSLGFVEGLNNKIGYLYHRLLIAEFAAYWTATQKSDLLRFHCRFPRKTLSGLLCGASSWRSRRLVLHFSRSPQP